ncbi:hypothetical protein BH09VER1_BH09VER1_28460 [soil metagenome]
MPDKATLSTLSGKPLIQEYAQGRAREATGEIADFIAPTVNTTKHTGKYRVYNKERRFEIPETLRGLGGEATKLRFDRSDADFNATPHALDVELDNIEVEESEGENLLMEAADEAASLGGMAHEKEVIDTALASAGSVPAAGAWSNPDVDPVAAVNQVIVSVLLAAGGGSMLEVGIIIDPNSVIAFFANKNVKSYFPGIATIAPTLENMKTLFVGKIVPKISFLATNVAKPGKAAVMDFVMADAMLVFARNGNPTRRDPSFMKSFRPRNRWMIPGTYDRTDGRGQVVKMDWSVDVALTNNEAGKYIPIS